MRYLLFAAALLLAPVQADARNITAFFGLNRSTMTIEFNDPSDEMELASKTGGYGTIMAEPFDSLPYLIFGLSLSNKGAIAEDEDMEELGSASVSMSLTYIELSVLGKLEFATTPTANVYLIAGPYVGRRVGCEVSVDLDVTGDDELDALGSLAVGCQDMLGGEAKSDVGLSAGLGVDARASGNLFVSFSTLLNHSVRDIFIDGDGAKHRYLTARLGFGVEF